MVPHQGLLRIGVVDPRSCFIRNTPVAGNLLDPGKLLPGAFS
jgi:hypothetical protein